MNLFPPGNLPNPGIEPMSPALLVDLFTAESLGKLQANLYIFTFCNYVNMQEITFIKLNLSVCIYFKFIFFYKGSVRD